MKNNDNKRDTIKSVVIIKQMVEGTLRQFRKDSRRKWPKCDGASSGA